MKVPYTKSGKCGQMVWQRARYGQICYPAFIPFNPRTPAQVAVRSHFAAVSARWRELTEEQRIAWCKVAKSKKSKPRLLQCGPLTGFLLFVKINVPLANRGMAQIDMPPGYAPLPEPAVPNRFETSGFDQPLVGPTLFLLANQLKEGGGGPPRKLAARHPA
jgi:hypothetical protein